MAWCLVKYKDNFTFYLNQDMQCALDAYKKNDKIVSYILISACWEV